MKRIITIAFCAILILGVFAGCEQRESEMVSYNLSLEADNFNVVRQLTVINCIEGDVLFQMTGKMSINVDETESQLEITVEDENGQYQKHFVGLADNVTYTCIQIDAQNVENYKYTINFNPNMWLPLEVETVN